MKLIATKNQTYKTRHLVAGDPFEVSDRVGHLLIAIRKAKPAAETPEPKAPVKMHEEAPWIGEAAKGPITTYETPNLTPKPPATEEEVVQLRRVARRLGIAVDKRWGAQRLRDLIAQAQATP